MMAGQTLIKGRVSASFHDHGNFGNAMPGPVVSAGWGFVS